MTFLVTQITVLLLLAAMAGAAIVYGWMSRRLEQAEAQVVSLRSELKVGRPGPRTPEPASTLNEAKPELKPEAEAETDAELAETEAEPAEDERAAAEDELVESDGEPVESDGEPAADNLLESASHGEPDDLQRINGVGPKLAGLLNEIGVYYFWQIAEWKQADIERVDAMLARFKGRIERDEWVEQARALME